MPYLLLLRKLIRLQHPGQAAEGEPARSAHDRGLPSDTQLPIDTHEVAPVRTRATHVLK